MNKQLHSGDSSRKPGRRRFIGTLTTATAAGVAALTLPTNGDAQDVFTDVDLLNFALNLEYLKAELYTVVTTGETIEAFGVQTDGGSGTRGMTSGGAAVAFNEADLTAKRVAQELADEERAHVSLLQNTIGALGGVYVNKPAINLDALGQDLFSSEDGFLQIARMLEDLTVTAYSGLVELFSSKAVVSVARILASEAAHSGNVRYLLTRSGAQSQISLDALDVATPSDHARGGVQYFPSDANKMIAARTPGEVLYLLYGGANLASGGVFPLGLAGNPALTFSSPAPAVHRGALLTANPNPIPLTNGSAYGRTTVSWSAPAPTQQIQVRVGSPTGPLFTTSLPSGSLMTNVWVSEGMILYLQDVSDGKPLTAQNTLATLILRTFSS